MAVFITIIVFLASNPSLFTDLVGSGKGTEDELIWSDEPSYTLKNLICNPGHSAKMLLGTFVGFFGTFFGDMISGGFGWLQISSSPVIVSCCFAILLGLALSESNQTIVMSKKQRIITGVAVIGAIGLVILSMWIFLTPISYQYIAGVQGRYFIVTMLPVFMMFRNNRLSLKNDLGNKGIIAICVLVVFAVFEIWTRIAG